MHLRRIMRLRRNFVLQDRYGEQKAMITSSENVYYISLLCVMGPSAVHKKK